MSIRGQALQPEGRAPQPAGDKIDSGAEMADDRHFEPMPIGLDPAMPLGCTQGNHQGVWVAAIYLIDCCVIAHLFYGDEPREAGPHGYQSPGTFIDSLHCGLGRAFHTTEEKYAQRSRPGLNDERLQQVATGDAL